MNDGLPRLLELRQQSVRAAERDFKFAKGREARHYARLSLQKRRRALDALKEVTRAQH